MKTHKAVIILLSIICSVFFPSCSTTEPSLNKPPTCEITQPSNNALISLGNIVEIVVNASDPDGQIVYVKFFIDNELRHIDYKSPYGYTWDTSEDQHGVHVIRAEAVDDDAYSKTYTVTVTTSWLYHQPEQVNDGWETASLGSVGLDSTRLISLMNNLNSTENHLIHGIIIIKNNRLVFEEYFNGLTHPTWGETPVTFNRNRMHVLSSVAKSITATLVGIAIEKGFISSVDAKVFDFYPELADLNIGQKQDITLRHLLTMSSGLGWDEQSFPLTDPRNDLTRFISIALNSNDDLARFILDMEMKESPDAYTKSGLINHHHDS